MSFLTRQRTARVRFLQGIADARGTHNVGDVAEISAEWARDEIAAGRAEATDAEVGQAAAVVAMVPCRACGYEQSEYIGQCQVCGVRLL